LRWRKYIAELRLDTLFDLLRLKIEELRLLRRKNADHLVLLEVIDEIMLTQKVIDQKKFETPGRPVKSP
jgi:hypothetical protein